MSGPLMIVRAALLGVLLFTVASLQHARGVELESAAPCSFNRVASAQQHEAHGSDVPAPGQDHRDDTDGQDFGGSIEGGGDLDDFEDIVSHPQWHLDGQLWPGLATHAAIEHARACARLEDRRFEKPPRV